MDDILELQDGFAGEVGADGLAAASMLFVGDGLEGGGFDADDGVEFVGFVEIGVDGVDLVVVGWVGEVHFVW